jgi:ribosomal-protein-alanine N-acetyltransferase
LRKFIVDDIPAVFTMLSREDINAWLETDPMQSIEEAEARVRSRIGLFKDKMGFRWAITLKSAPAQVIGSCGYFSVRRGTATVEAGYELHPDYWRQGIMTEALGAIIDLGFAQMGLNRIDAMVMPENIASIKLLEKLGFYNEGLLREYENWGSKGFTDLCMLSLLRRVWEKSDESK